ncbi:hypothetical protein ElyMa_000716500 [Elysia marginata]|uniref:Uncharacterized protein n=1 Tax=Elysia marginata TaxID=1093978 RepID=A0AAV4GLG6_9GAST|nr:hypothetical protein ElyMa_000716500 [Elysia marginata]
MMICVTSQQGWPRQHEKQVSVGGYLLVFSPPPLPAPSPIFPIATVPVPQMTMMMDMRMMIKVMIRVLMKVTIRVPSRDEVVKTEESLGLLVNNTQGARVWNAL